MFGSSPEKKRKKAIDAARKAAPQECGLTEISFSKRTVTVGTKVVSEPDVNSSVYKDTLSDSFGRFNAYVYHLNGGRYITKNVPDVREATRAEFSCYKTRNTGDCSPITDEVYGDEVEAQKAVLNKVRKLGICATCQVCGLSPLEASNYYADLLEAEARVAESQARLTEARKELQKIDPLVQIPTRSSSPLQED